MLVKKTLVLAGFSAAATLMAANAAWAWCSPMQQNDPMLQVMPNAATPGTYVTVEAKQQPLGTYAVEILWAQPEQLLGTATLENGQFTAQVRIPEVSFGTSDILVRVDKRDVSRSFDVVTPAELARRQEAAAKAGAAQNATVSGGSAAPALLVPPRAAGQPAGGSTANGAASPAAPRPAATPSGATADAVPPAAAGAPATADLAPSSKTALGDLWEGFEGEMRSGPSITDLPRSSSDPLADSGVVLLLVPAAIGALGAGFAVAELRRRRAVKVNA